MVGLISNREFVSNECVWLLQSAGFEMQRSGCRNRRGLEEWFEWMRLRFLSDGNKINIEATAKAAMAVKYT